ncbi:hypothetical protein CCACVL1_01895, partial [Corchorus capsularis]
SKSSPRNTDPKALFPEESKSWTKLCMKQARPYKATPKKDFSAR